MKRVTKHEFSTIILGGKPEVLGAKDAFSFGAEHFFRFDGKAQQSIIQIKYKRGWDLYIRAFREISKPLKSKALDIALKKIK